MGISYNSSSDYYKILGISPSAKEDDIKKAFRSLVKSNHTDKGGDKEKCTEIIRAYRILINTETRKEYDIQREKHFQRIPRRIKRTFKSSGNYSFNYGQGNQETSSFLKMYLESIQWNKGITVEHIFKGLLCYELDKVFKR